MRIGVYIQPIIQQQGGIHHYTKQLVMALERYGSYDYELIGSERVDAGLPTRFTPQAALPIYHPSRRRNPVDLSGFDLLIDPSHFGSWGLFPAEKRIVCQHDLSGLHYPHYHRWQTVWAHRLLLRSWLKKSKGLFTVSRSIRDEIHKRYPSLHPAVVSPGLEFIEQQTERPATDLPERFFLFTGAAEPRKNLRRILQALKPLPEGVHLVITGPQGWKFDLTETVASHELSSRVHHLGYVPQRQLAYLLQHAVGLVYPSIYEGFGLPVLEAMHLGCPVVTSNRGACAELIDSAGIKFDPSDSHAIQLAMMQLLEDGSLRTQCISEGKARSKAFLWKHSIARLERYLDSLAAS